MRTTARAVIGAVALGAGVMLASATGSAAPSTVASTIPVTITASAIDFGALAYVDTVSVRTAAGSTPALELTLRDATLHGLALNLPCVPVRLGGLTGGTTTTGATTVGLLTVYATDVVATVDGTQVRWSSTDPAYLPPPAGTTLHDDSLVDPTIVTVLASAPALHVPALRTSATFCSSPGSAALPDVATTPEPTPTPSVSPSVTPSQPPEETPGTAPDPSPSGNGTPTEPTPSPTPTTEPSPSADPSTPAADPSAAPTP